MSNKEKRKLENSGKAATRRLLAMSCCLFKAESHFETEAKSSQHLVESRVDFSC